MSKEDLECYVGTGIRLAFSWYGIEGHVKAVRDEGINIGGAWYNLSGNYIITPVELEQIKTK